VPEVKQFRLPDVGEGLTEAEIVSWKVKPGDSVKINDIVVEIETAKSLVELPSPFAGVISELLVEEGRTVDVGTPIISVETGSAGAPVLPAGDPTTAGRSDDLTASVAAGIPTPGPEEAVEPGLIGGPAPGGRTSVLVGYGPRQTEAKRRPRKAGLAATPSEPQAAVAQGAVQSTLEVGQPVTATPAIADAPPAEPDMPPAADAPAARVHVLAKPPVRKLARDLGVDLTLVSPSGPNGTITRADVEQAASGAVERAAGAGAVGSVEQVAAPAAVGTRETRIPIKGVRKMTAQAMVASAFTAPHVTEWLAVDVTRTVELVERLRGHRDFRDVKVSPLLVLAKAMILAIRRTPEVNATWDEQAQEIVLKHYVNLGIAAATPRGLVVPNVKGAESLTLRELAEAITALVATAREGRTQPAEMAQGTITITNVGVFGVDAGTPILNPARPRSWPSARSATCRGSSTAPSCRARSASSR
jgi:pyruvate dehydrogenase E2 component (dihydrolipoamide acetyltransferase)